MIIKISDALSSLHPGAEYVVRGGVVEWLSPDITQPTEAEIQAEIARLEAEQPWKELRQKRNRLLAESDWVSMKAIDASIDGLGIQLPQVWMDYRQALRDLPANTTDPANPDWPVKPGGEA
jgi:hypothetical protein